MTAITYTAKRGIVATSFSVVDIDISAANADSSFNSVTTDLSGVLDNEWIKVSGFLTNTENNGWFEVAGNSVATKIIQDTGALIDEAAGENITIEGFLRGYGQGYDLETVAQQLSPSDKPVINTQESLSGVQESLFIRNDEEWNVTTDFIDEADWPQWKEFFRSVNARESFNIDIYGTFAAPDDLRSAFMVGAPTYLNPFGKTMQARFRVRLL